MKTYQIEFRSVCNHLYRIDIIDKSDHLIANTTERFPASDSPFTLDWDDSEDVFMPRRKCTGSISFLTDDIDILTKIKPSTHTDYRVIAYRNGSPFFYGFLSPDTFDTEYSSRYREVTLNVSDALTAMDYIPIRDFAKLDYLSYVSMEKIAQTIVSTISNYFRTQFEQPTMYFCLPMELLYLFRQCVSNEMLKDYHTGDSGMENAYEMKTMGDMLDMLMEISGCQLVQEGNRFIAQSFPYDGQVYEVNNGLSAFAPSLMTFSYRGTEHSISAFAGAKMLRLKSEFEYAEPELEMPDFPLLESYLEKNYEYYYDGGTRYRKAKIVRKADLFPDITLYYKKITATYADNALSSTNEETATETQFLNYTPLFNSGIFIEYTVHPADGSQTYYIGGEFCELQASDYYKPDPYTLRGLLVTTAPRTTDVASIKSIRPYYFEPGSYVRFTFDVDTFTITHNIGSNNVMYRNNRYGCKFLFSLRIGDKYAANGVVNADSAAFYCERKKRDSGDVFERGELIYNMSDEELEELGFSGKGYYFQVPTGGYQDIELSIMSYASSWGSACLYSMLKLEYLGVPNQDNFYNKDRQEKNVLINGSFSEDIDLEPALSSKHYTRQRHFDNCLTDSSGVAQESFTPRKVGSYDTLLSAVRPEDALVKRYKQFYEARRYKIQLQTYIPYGYLYKAYISNNLSSRAVLVAKSDDYRKDQSVLTFLDTDSRSNENGGIMTTL